MTIQIAVKLPDRLVSELDVLIANGAFANRSDAVRRGIEALVVTGRRQDIEQRYREGFTKRPETTEEMLDAERLAFEAIDAEPWDRWW